jgi:cytochrome c biogenesis protein
MGEPAGQPRPGPSGDARAAGAAIGGIILTFLIRRRRVWVRARSGTTGRTVVEVAGLTLGGTTAEFTDIVDRLKAATGGNTTEPCPTTDKE